MVGVIRLQFKIWSCHEFRKWSVFPKAIPLNTTEEALAFANALSILDGLTPAYDADGAWAQDTIALAARGEN